LDIHKRHKEDKKRPLIKSGGIAIVGNMNVGKTTLFSRLSGKKTESINIPGNTVSITRGKLKGAQTPIFDTPGIFSIFSTNEDERASRDIFIPDSSENVADHVILMADAKNLKRSVAIALQYAEYGLPMIFNLNMIDEAISRGIEIDKKKLSELLGFDVCVTIAREGIGLKKLVSNLSQMKKAKPLVSYPSWIEEFLGIVKKLLKTVDVSYRAVGLLLLTEDRYIEKYLLNRYGDGMLQQLKDLVREYKKEERLSNDILLTNLYNKMADQIVGQVQAVAPPTKSRFLDRFGDWCTQFSTGIPIAVAILYLLYLFIGKFGATFLVDNINGLLFEGFLIPWTQEMVGIIPSQFLRELIIDPDFGILPTGVFLALGLVVPVLFCFYIAFGFLEDSGYLPRISLLLDKLLKKLGLNGKGVIPLIMGFSCVTMAILTTRLLDTKKEKNIASFLLFLALPCAPLLAVMFIILEKMPFSATITVFGVIFLQVFIAGYLANKILPGNRAPLFMEIPAMRMPKPFQIITMSASKTYFFMKEALPVFIIASFFVFLFERIGGLDFLEQSLGPILSQLMGLPEKSIQVFIKTMIRRESGAAELEHIDHLYTHLQLVVNLLVMTFISPCLNAVIVLFKERGIKAASIIIVSVTFYAILVGSIVNHFCLYFDISFQ